MISITIHKNSDKYTSLSCIGHAGFSEAGTDIVCAAASVLVINTLNAIEQLTDTHIEETAVSKKGQLMVQFPEGTAGGSTLLMDAMMMGLLEIERQYGRRYITLDVKEVLS